ncbi:MAG: RNA 2',3'-cyclic phosphodiesterase [Deltaproteobacteria bacterium]|nr:RNA 2',3'-cyclic phosphodiesterase [Deltaproteobacteria bacterium]
MNNIADNANIIRAFIALPLSGSARKKLGSLSLELTKALKEAGAKFRPVKPESMHMTLKFLGDMEMVSVPLLVKTIAESVKDFAPFRFRLEDLGFFGSPHRPRILFMDTRQGKSRLRELAGLIEQACEAHGFEREERPFKAHLTLARFKKGPRQGLDVMLENFREGRQGILQTADRIVLYKSDLTPTGPIYDELDVMTLAGV